MKKAVLIVLIHFKLFSLYGQQWSDAVTIFYGGSNYVSDIAVDDAGKIHCVWTREIPNTLNQDSEDNFRIYYSYSDHGEEWSAALDISKNIFGLAGNADIGIYKSSRIVISYILNLDYFTKSKLLYQTYDGFIWSLPAEITNMQLVTRNELVVDSNSKIHFFWYVDYTASRSFYTRYLYNNSLSEIIQPYNTTGKSLYLEDAEIDMANTRHFVFNGFDPEFSGNHWRVEYANCKGEQWSILQAISKDESTVVECIDMALNSCNEPHIIWAQSRDTDQSPETNLCDVYYSYCNGGLFSEPVMIGTKSVSQLAIAFDGNDIPHIAFCQATKPGYKLIYCTLENNFWKYYELEENKFFYPGIILKSTDSVIWMAYTKIDTTYWSPNQNNTFILMRKLNVPVGIESNPAISHNLKISPNPFTDKTRVEFYSVFPMKPFYYKFLMHLGRSYSAKIF